MKPSSSTQAVQQRYVSADMMSQISKRDQVRQLSTGSVQTSESCSAPKNDVNEIPALPEEALEYRYRSSKFFNIRRSTRESKPIGRFVSNSVTGVRVNPVFSNTLDPSSNSSPCCQCAKKQVASAETQTIAEIPSPQHSVVEASTMTESIMTESSQNELPLISNLPLEMVRALKMELAVREEELDKNHRLNEATTTTNYSDDDTEQQPHYDDDFISFDELVRIESTLQENHKRLFSHNNSSSIPAYHY